MSAKTIVNRSKLFAAAAALGAAGLIASPAAHADSCTVNGGTLALNVHPAGQTYTVNVPANGSTLAGPTYINTNGVDRVSGTVTSGIVAGNEIDFIADWNPAEGGGSTHFRGTVGSDGIAHGTATGSSTHDPGGQLVFNPGPWDSTQPLSCAAVNTGPNPANQQPKQGPTVTPHPGPTGVTFTVTDRSGVASQCTYSSEGFETGFGLPANGSFDLFVPAIRLFKNRTGKITCDNGTSTNTSVFF